MTTNAPTIIDLKTTFLRKQIIALSQPLRASPETLDQITTPENALRQKAIDDALVKLNAKVRQPNKLVYGPQALRHVAEQIDRLYWRAGESAAVVGVEEWLERGVDYRLSTFFFRAM